MTDSSQGYNYLQRMCNDMETKKHLYFVHVTVDDESHGTTTIGDFNIQCHYPLRFITYSHRFARTHFPLLN